MKCPVCYKNMKDKSYSYWSIGDWDSDYSSGWHEEYVCTHCGVKYVDGEYKNLDLFGGKATQKQIKCVNFINQWLDMNYEPILKLKTTKFIKKYLEEAKEVYYENMDMMDENYLSFDEWTCWW